MAENERYRGVAPEALAVRAAMGEHSHHHADAFGRMLKRSVRA